MPLPASPPASRSKDVMVAIMGPTGTGKSSFINLLTNDENIRVGHSTESETNRVLTSRYFDPESGLSVTLVDTPGFDDSREGCSDVHILENITNFLREE